MAGTTFYNNGGTMIHGIYLFGIFANHAWATGTIASCGTGDAPTGYDTATCTPSGGAQPMCYDNGTEFVCDLTRYSECLIDGNYAAAVTKYDGGAHDFSFWGACDGLKFCCVLDDTDDDVVSFVVGGTDYTDTLGLTSEAGEMEPHRGAALDGYILGHASSDNISGSNYAGTDYWDHLFGHYGADVIHGGEGADYLHGGFGADSVFADAGNDRLVSGGGSDYLDGGAGADTLCATAKTGGVCDNAYLAGWNGNDILWVPYDSSCDGNPATEPIFMPAQSSGSDTEQCGDNDWDEVNDSGWCDTLINAEPATCAEP